MFFEKRLSNLLLLVYKISNNIVWFSYMGLGAVHLNNNHNNLMYDLSKVPYILPLTPCIFPMYPYSHICTYTTINVHLHAHINVNMNVNKNTALRYM